MQIMKLFSDAINGVNNSPEDNLNDLLSKTLNIHQQIRRLEYEKEKLSAQIKEIMENEHYDSFENESGSVKLVRSSTSRLDKKLLLAHGISQDVITECSKTTTSSFLRYHLR